MDTSIDMHKAVFKQKVIEWLATNKIFTAGRKIRVYTYKGQLEVRIYTSPMEYMSSRVSFRTLSKDDSQRHGTRGHHNIRIPMYVHITEEDFKSEDKSFLLEVCKDSLLSII